MPDLKSELTRVKQSIDSLDNLSFDDDPPSPDEQLPLNTTNLYAWIQAHPGSSVVDMKPHFTNPTQIGTRLSQAFSKGFLTRKTNKAGEYIYFRTDKRVMSGDERIAVMNAARQALKGVARASKQKARKTSQAASEQKGSAGTKPVIESDWDVDAIVNKLGLKQAKALYEELKKYFGA